MKFRMLFTSALMAMLAFGCAKNETATTAAADKSGVRVIEITGSDSMKYNLTSIEVAVGEEVTIKLTNVGTMPKQAMGHNLVVLKAGSDSNAFSMAAASASATDYIPASLKGQVVGYTKMLGPKESATITIKFTEAGEYPFLCSFPAHFQVGMKGMITVK